MNYNSIHTSILTALALTAPVWAEPAPTGTLAREPNVTYIGVGMTMTLTASDLADKDCVEGETAPVDAPTPTSVQFLVTVGDGEPVTSTGSPQTITFPNEQTTVNIELQVDDTATPVDDGGFLTVASSTVTVRTPTSVVEVGSGQTITSPVFGGKSTMQIKDELDEDFTVAGVGVGESSDNLSFFFVKDGAVVAGDAGNASVNDDEAFTTISSGQFYDNIGKPLSELTTIATASNVQETLRLVVNILGHNYTANIGSKSFPLTNKFNRAVSTQVKRHSPGWGTDSQNHSYTSIQQQ